MFHVVLLICSLITVCLGETSPSRPNILLLVADDMGWGDLGVNVPQLPSNTPNLDTLARQGLRLNDFHSAASLCTPSRAALLTGRLGLRTGVVTNFGTGSVAGLPRNETTLAEVLKQAGYRTAMIGKWHLGTRPGFHPLDRGFDEYLGVPYSLDMGCATPPGLNLPPAHACPRSEDASHESLALPLYEGRRITHQPVPLRELSKRYVNFAEQFIQANTSTPYLLYAAFSHVHVPLAHSARFKNATGRGDFADTLAEMDWMAGRLVRASASRSTLTWFLSDNGAWEVKCSLAGGSGPYRGEWQRDLTRGGGGSASKQTVWEGGHRVPAILHWPPYIKTRRVSRAVTSALDVLPTVSELVGAKMPLHRTFDGLSHARALLQGTPLTSHKAMFHPNSGASGDIGDIGAVRMGRYKVVYYAGGAEGCKQSAAPARKLQPPLSFDLNRDEAEAYPLSGSTGELLVRRANIALTAFLTSVRADNTSHTDYHHDPAARPCCDVKRPGCACSWDPL